MDKKTKEALVALVRALMNEEGGREADKYREDNDRLYCENSGLRDELSRLKADYKSSEKRNFELLAENEELIEKRERLERKLDSVYEEYEYALVLQTERENKCVQLELTIEKLQEQADIDKMQIALYDKENKELRKKFAFLKELVRRMGQCVAVDVPDRDVYAAEENNNEN